MSWRRSRRLVDALAQGSGLEDGLAGTLFHATVVLEKRHIVGGTLDPGDQPGLVIELETGGTHVMADAGALDTGGEVVADLVLGVAAEPVVRNIATCSARMICTAVRTSAW
jgi:hypothetical protein